MFLFDDFRGAGFLVVVSRCIASSIAAVRIIAVVFYENDGLLGHQQ